MYQFQDEIVAFLLLKPNSKPTSSNCIATQVGVNSKNTEYEWVNKGEKSNKLCFIE